MYAPAQLLSLIENRLAELGMSQAQLGLRAFGKADNTAIQSLKKGSSPAIDRLEAMAAALGWELYFGPYRQKPGAMNEGTPVDDFSSKNPMRAGFSPIPWFEPKIGSGSAPVAFLDSWLSSNGLILDNLVAVAPTMVSITGFDAARTLAMIDTSAPRRGFALWALKEPAGVSVASVSFDGADLIIESANRETAPRLIRNWSASDVRPAGKVAWLGFMPHQ
ncbi:MAG: hypothetical protein Q7J44_13995 [Pseudotabrizicola sp.]|uniref:hypothetical protein n=1 Tax=Pseudotabrizicola sp. TaxID=2939647 RepID=UPI002717C38A|nr:hypothetical protein [Pseudotabrizicola sp.]MDO9639647.1 hypothetical protein [Pseudotabrizicola sp.]